MGSPAGSQERPVVAAANYATLCNPQARAVCSMPWSPQSRHPVRLVPALCPYADTMQPETSKTLTTIRNSGARLLNLINDILDAAAIRKVGRPKARSMLCGPAACCMCDALPCH